MLQARSMSSRLTTINAMIATFAVCCCFAVVAAAPYQELAPRKGFVPVYIREGDTPLSEIHPKLAEAFGEIESASLKLEHDAKDDSQVERSDTIAPSTTTAAVQEIAVADADKVKATAEAEAAAADGEKGSNVSEDAKASEKESDIASFDVVKGDSNAEPAVAVKENENEEKAVAE